MADEYKQTVTRIADHMLHESRRRATQLGRTMEVPESKVLADVLDRLQEIRPVGVQLERDKRAGYWRVRMRLFAPSGSLEADSDLGLPENAPGEAVVRGLPGVAEWAGDLVRYFHEGREETAQWLDQVTIQKKLKSLRPTLSRKQGKATWRIEYRVDSLPWKALIDLQRESA